MRVNIALILVVLVAPGMTGCFGPGQDDDLLEKEDEQAGWDVTVTDLDGAKRTYHVQSDWTKADADQDGLDDFQERALGLDPNSPDTDQDGLVDAYNVIVDPEDARFEAWAANGIVFEPNNDGTRTFLGEWDHQAEPLLADTDADGLNDGDEVGGREYSICGRVTAVRTRPGQEDTDGDNLMDGDELFVHGSDPTKRDTDGDGAIDLVDVDPCVDLVLGYETFSLEIHNDSVEGPYRIEIYWPNDRFPVSIGPLTAEQRNFDLRPEVDPEDVDDGQGNLRDGDRNLTLQVFAYAGDGNDRRILDIGSGAGGTSQMILAYDGATGRQYALRAGQEPLSDEDTETFSGADGTLTLRLQRVARGS